VDDGKFVEEAERDLYKAIQSSVVYRQSSIDEFLNTVVKLIPSINAFFDKVLVMTDDEKIKQNRLALVGQVANLSHGIADLSKLEGF
jgi:glycyl-tRNA synthetase beta subunit